MPQHKRASAQASAEACRAKQSTSGFSRNSRVSSEAIEHRLQHKRASAQTSSEACQAKQSNTGFSRNSRASPEAIEQRLQYKRASAQALAEACRAKQSNSGLCSSSSNEAIEQRSSRSNRIAASTGTFKPQWKQSSSGFSRKSYKKLVEFQQEQSYKSFRRSLSSEAIDQRPQQKQSRFVRNN